MLPVLAVINFIWQTNYCY